MNPTATNLSSYSRYVLTLCGEKVLVFPDIFVAEIMLVERSYLLSFPFYAPAMLGVVHFTQRGVVPLVSLRRILLNKNALVPEKLTVVRLSLEAEHLAGAGLVVDKVLGSSSSEQYTAQANHTRIENILPLIPADVWQPQRWHPQVPQISEAIA